VAETLNPKLETLNKFRKANFKKSNKTQKANTKARQSRLIFGF
jgi:hypothetical protein